MRPFHALLGLAFLLSGACIPYSTGTTAVPIPEGSMEPNLALYFVPGGMENLGRDSIGSSLLGIDMELRYGIDERSDLGVRFPGFSGAVLNYKRRLDDLEDDGPAVAALFGVGVVNAGQHFEMEASLLASGLPNDRVTPYGGIKTIVVFPATPEAVSDDPSIGAFAGMRLGSEGLGISPEIAVFYDRSALDIREGSWILVPSITFHGQELFDLLLGRRSPGRTRRPPGPWPPRFP